MKKFRQFNNNFLDSFNRKAERLRFFVFLLASILTFEAICGIVSQNTVIEKVLPYEVQRDMSQWLEVMFGDEARKPLWSCNIRK